MEIAVLADIHGNSEALQTCIQYAYERKIKHFIFLGDYVGGCAFPLETMDLLYSLKDSYDCIFIKGDKEDAWLTNDMNKDWKEFDSTTGTLYYTYKSLRKQDIDFFKSLNYKEEVKLPNMEAFTICHHVSYDDCDKHILDQDTSSTCMDECNTTLVLCAHTHVQQSKQFKDKKIVNPGSVGLPLHSSGKTQFMILHGANHEWTEEFVSLTYNIEKTIKNLYRANLNQIAPYWCMVSEQLLRTGKISHQEVLKHAMTLCKEKEGICNWLMIPEKYWEEAYHAIFGNVNIQSYAYDKTDPSYPICLNQKQIYTCEWMTLYSDTVKMPTGSIIDTYHRLHIPKEAVCVVIMNDNDEILLIASKRYTTGRLEWEVVAGGIEAGECAQTAAERECIEETGCNLKELQYMCSQNPSNGISDLLIHFYLAKVDSESSIIDENEVAYKKWVSKADVSSILKNNQCKCGVSMFALLYVLQFYSTF